MDATKSLLRYPPKCTKPKAVRERTMLNAAYNLVCPEMISGLKPTYTIVEALQAEHSLCPAEARSFVTRALNDARQDLTNGRTLAHALAQSGR